MPEADPERAASPPEAAHARRGAEALLTRLERASRPFDACEVCVFVAHPDDETIGCGAQLSRLRHATLITLTDGSPPDLGDATRLGFTHRAAYARARQLELHAALRAGRASLDVRCFAVCDQTAALQLVPIVHRLSAELAARGTCVVLTHAYEGGHPDHDAAAFAAHASTVLLARRGLHVEVVEMPFYRAMGSGMVRQQFPLPSPTQVTELALDAAAQKRKARMVRAYTTQAAVLHEFDGSCERFRPAPSYRFDELPNEGALLYERYPWGMRGGHWLALASAASAELSLPISRACAHADPSNEISR